MDKSPREHTINVWMNHDKLINVNSLLSTKMQEMTLLVVDIMGNVTAQNCQNMNLDKIKTSGHRYGDDSDNLALKTVKGWRKSMKWNS